jgi:hypothetical protein
VRQIAVRFLTPAAGGAVAAGGTVGLAAARVVPGLPGIPAAAAPGVLSSLVSSGTAAISAFPNAAADLIVRWKTARAESRRSAAKSALQREMAAAVAARRLAGVRPDGTQPVQTRRDRSARLIRQLGRPPAAGGPAAVPPVEPTAQQRSARWAAISNTTGWERRPAEDSDAVGVQVPAAPTVPSPVAPTEPSAAGEDRAAEPPSGSAPTAASGAPGVTVRPLLVEIRDGRLEAATVVGLPSSAGGGALLARLVLRAGAPPVALLADLDGAGDAPRPDQLPLVDAVRRAMVVHLAAVPTAQGEHLSAALQQQGSLWFLQQPPFDGAAGQGNCLALIADAGGTGEAWSFAAGRYLRSSEVGDMAAALGLRSVETEVDRQQGELSGAMS